MSNTEMVMITVFEISVAISAILAAAWLNSIDEYGWGYIYLSLIVLLLAGVKIKLGDTK